MPLVVVELLLEPDDPLVPLVPLELELPDPLLELSDPLLPVSVVVVFGGPVLTTKLMYVPFETLVLSAGSWEMTTPAAYWLLSAWVTVPTFRLLADRRDCASAWVSPIIPGTETVSSPLLT